jgi:hypothetical protein
MGGKKEKTSSDARVFFGIVPLLDFRSRASAGEEVFVITAILYFE